MRKYIIDNIGLILFYGAIIFCIITINARLGNINQRSIVESETYAIKD